MPNIYARSARSGKLYEVNIAGTQPTPEEQSYIEQRIDNIEGFGAVEAPLPTEEVDDASTAGNLISGFGRGFLTSFTELPGGIVGLGESVLGYEPGTTAVGEVAQDISDAGRSGVEYMLGQSDGSVSSKTGEAFGSLASFLVPGTAAAKAAKVAGAGLKGQKVAGLTGAGAMGVGLGAKDQINRVAEQIAQGNQVDPDDFIKATQLGGAIGASEILPFQRVLGDVLQILRKVPKGSQEAAIKTIAGRLKRAAGTFAAEGAQEALAGIAQDLVEQNLYNPNANIGATADEEFIYGGSAGATLSFLVDSIRGRQINKMDKAFTQLQDDLADESAETAEKAAFAAKSVQTGTALPGQPKLLAPPKTNEDIVEGSEQDTDAKIKSLGLSPEEEAIASSQAARERTTGFAQVKLAALPEDEAARIRRNRIATGVDPDLDVSLDELQSTIGQEAYVREYKKQKPNMWRESGQNPRNQKSFSFEQYERAVEAVRSQKKATVPVIQAAARSDGKPVPLSVVREIQQEMGRKGVLNQVGESKWEVMEERAEQESPAAPLRRSYSELERKIDEVRQERLEVQERRDAAKDMGDLTVASTAEQEMAEADRRIDRLNNARSNVEAQLNQLDPENPVVNSIDATQQEANRARQVSEAVSQEQMTDEYARKRQSVANALRKYLQTIGLGDRVDLVTQNVIFPESVDSEAKFDGIEDQLRAQGVIEGFEQAGENGRRVIGIAMEIYDPNLSEEELALKLRGVMNHEMIHALRGLGLFTDKEWQTLTNAARNKKRVRFVGGKLQEREYTYYDRAEAIYGPMGADQDLMAEEAVAEMFRDYVDGKLKIAGRPQSLLKRIARFFTSIFRSHNDAGFKQAADIFQNITTTDKAKQIGRRDTGYGEIEAPKSDQKYSTAGVRAGFLVPEKGNIERIRQSFKDVTKRISNLTEAAKKLSDGTISYDQYDKLVNEFKPIIPYDTVPAPESTDDMRNALQASDPRKVEKLGRARLIENGTRVKLRLDIPAYTRQGVWIPTIHGQDNRTIAHESTAIITDAQFSASEKVALRIAAGATKGPFATINGSFVQASPDEAFAIAQEMMNDPDVVQVGFDPERHSYFYDRTTTQPVIAAEQVVQIGPLVLAKNPTFAGKDKFKYSVSPSNMLTYNPVKHNRETTGAILNGVKVNVPAALAKLTNFNRLNSDGTFADHRIYKTPEKVAEHKLKDALHMFWKERGGKTLDPANQKDLMTIARLMAAEAAVALKRDPSAIGWYGKTIDNMFEFLSSVKAGNEMLYPELSVDPEAKAAFKFVLAITSNGVAVEDNFAYTSEMFDTWKETGRFPVRGYGKRLDAMTQAFEFYNSLKDLGYTDTQIENFLSQETTVGELRKDPVIQELGIKVPSGEAADVKISYAYLLGPKIGNGFYMNLGGDFSALTMDVWWMRFWNRLTGNPFKQATAKTLSKNNKRIIDAINAEDKTDYEVSKIEDAMSSLGIDVLTPETAAPIAQEINRLYQLDFNRVGRANDDIIKKYMEDNGVGRGIARDRAPLLPVPEKTELFLAADTYSQNLDPRNPQDAPRNSTERKQMREAANMARQILKDESGVDITNADFQALMWYAEKQLLLNAGVKPGRGADNDYLDGAIAVAKQKGFNDEQIAEALPATERHRVDVADGSERPNEGISPESDFQSTAGSIKYSIKGGRRAAIDVRIGVGFNGRAFRRRNGGPQDSQYDIKATYDVAGNSARTYAEQSVSTPRFIELNSSEQSAQQFSDAINQAKASLGEFGDSVFVYSSEEYGDMRLFLTEDGTGGFALKETGTEGAVDIVSVFNSAESPNKQVNYPMIRLATEEGGNMLDAFDIYLPKLYSANGFKVRSRLKWDDEQAPDGWDKEAFKNYNNGEPDVVFMYYQPDRIDVYEQGSEEGELFTDYMEAVEAQVGAALSPTSVNRYKDREIAQDLTEDNPNEFLTEQDDAQLADVREGINAEEKYDGTKLSVAPPKPTALMKAPLKTKTQYEYGYIQEGGRKLPVVLMYGNHVELDDGRTGGFGMKHLRERGHVQELIDAGFPSAEKAIFDIMYRWGAQGYRDGAEVIAFPDGGGSIRFEYDAGKKGTVILSVTKRGVSYNGQPAYTVRTAYPKNKKKLSVAFSAIDPNRIQNQIPVAQDSLMYSRASNLLARVLGVVYDRNKAEDIADNFLQKFQDSMLPVGRMIDDLKAQGATITDANDTYLREELYHGITGSKIADNEKNLYEPMLNLVKGIELTEAQASVLRANSRFVREALQAGKPLKQVLADAFLYARHAEERNAYIRSIDPANDSGSGMTDTEARAINQFFDSLSGTERQRFINIGLAADRIVQSTNDIRVASGLTPDFNDGETIIDAETGEVIPAGPNYTSYVPLRGILDPENESNEEYSGRPSSRPKFGARGREDMRMFGRFELAKDIMANLMVQNQNAIVRSERNRVGQSFLNMLRNEPRLTDSYARIVEQRPTIRVLSGGVVKTRPDPRFADRDDILIVKEGGQEVAIQIDDPRIALAMRGASGMSPQHASGLVKVLGKVNRYLSNINTSWNPEFLITNMVRDLQTAGVNINQYEMNGLTSDALKSIPSALKGIKRSIVNDDNTSEWSKIYKDFVDAGGQNATNMMGDLSDQLGRLEDMLKEVSDAGADGAFRKTKAGFGKILETLENYNTVVENGVRVATYKALLDRGFSRERAAQAARNVTVNFAKGGEYKTFMNSMYLFYNASLQGSFALLNGALRSSKVRKLWVGAMVTGILLDQMNSVLSDDDEDGQEIYDKIPDYVLEKNLILMDPFGVLPSERGYFKIPMPYGLNMAVNMGRSLSRAGRGGYTPSEATSSLVGTIIDTLNPIGDTPRIPLVDKDFEFQDILTTVSPSIGDPVVQYLTNSDYARKPIYKEPSSFGVPAPESQIHWTTTSPSAVFIANFLRKPFGLGDASDVRPGFIEVSPDTLEFWFDYATGGVGRFVQRTAEFGASTAPKIMTGEFEEAMLRSTPAIRQVVGSVSEREDLGKFVEKRDRVLLTRKDFIDARKKGDEERAQRIALAYKEELRVSGVINALNNARNKLVRKRKQIEESQYIPDAQKKVLIERMNERIKEIVTRANSLMSDL